MWSVPFASPSTARAGSGDDADRATRGRQVRSGLAGDDAPHDQPAPPRGPTDPKDSAPDRVAELPAGRAEWIDAAKGAAIMAVVFGHVWRGLDTAGLGPGAPIFETVDRFIYLFHMPAFFLLAGLTFPRVLARAGAARDESGGAAAGAGPSSRAAMTALARSRLERLLLPMILWTYLFIALRMLPGQLANEPTEPSALLRWPLPPYAHLWFLWALFGIQMLTATAWLAAGGRASARAGLGACLALAALAWPLGAQLSPLLSGFLGAVLHHLPAFVLGLALGLRAGAPDSLARGRGAPRRISPLLAAGGAALFALCQAASLLSAPAPDTGMQVQGLLSGLPTGLLRDLLSLGAALGFCALVDGLWSGRPGRGASGLRALGRNSMIIYLAHVPAAAAVRIAMQAAGIEDLATHLILGSVIGLLAPLLALPLLGGTRLGRALGV